MMYKVWHPGTWIHKQPQPWRFLYLVFGTFCAFLFATTLGLITLALITFGWLFFNT